MRVIAGSAKGRRLVGPNTRDTRPLTDRAKEGIFSAIGERVSGAEVLDLYAGSGSIGIEAISRGAAEATFVENAKPALEALRKNLADLGFEDRAKVFGRSVDAFLRSAKGHYDLIFVDPPWVLEDSVVDRQMEAVADLGGAGCDLVLHRRRTDLAPPAPSGWSLHGTYRYGDSHLLRYAQQYGDDKGAT